MGLVIHVHSDFVRLSFAVRTWLRVTRGYASRACRCSLEPVLRLPQVSLLVSEVWHCATVSLQPGLCPTARNISQSVVQRLLEVSLLLSGVCLCVRGQSVVKRLLQVSVLLSELCRCVRGQSVVQRLLQVNLLLSEVCHCVTTVWNMIQDVC